MTNYINPELVLSRFRDGTLVRNSWTSKTVDGRATACLLAAIAPQCGTEEEATACPADVLPQSFAQLVPWMDDCGTEEYWQQWVPEFAELLGRAHVLTDSDWSALDVANRLDIMREAERHIPTADMRVRALCAAALRALQSGDKKQMKATSAAVWAASSVWAVRAAANAVWAACEAASAASAAEWAARAAVRATTGAVWAAGAVFSPGTAARAAGAAAADRIIAAILKNWRAVIDAGEVQS